MSRQVMRLGACLLLIVLALPAQAVTSAFSYQGKLTDSGGQPASGSYDFQFKLYDDPDDGAQVGSTISKNGVAVQGGLFTVELDFGIEALARGYDLWLEITVVTGGPQVLTPRTKLCSAPYAVRAEIVPWSGVSGAPASLPPSGPAGGDLTGTYPNPTIGPNAVGSAEISDGAVGPSEIATGAFSNYTGSIQNLANSAANPSVAGSASTGHLPYCVAISGRYACVVNSGSDSLQVMDISNPASPAVVGSLTVTSLPYSVAVSGRYAYAVAYGSDTLQVIDLSNPANPVQVGGFVVADQPYCVAVSGRYAYVVSYGANSLQIIDVSNLSSMAVVGSVTTGAAPISVAVSGRHAYVTNYTANSLQVIDASNPASPVVVGTATTGTAPTSVAVAGRYAYVANSVSNSLQVIDVSNPASPTVVGTVTTGAQPVSVAVSGRYAYVANFGSDSMQVIDVSTAASPAVVGSVTTGDCPRGIAVSGRHACVVNRDSDTLQVMNIAGIESTAVSAHSLEAGALQVRGNSVVGNQLSVVGALNVGNGGILSDGDIAAMGSVYVNGKIGLGVRTPTYRIELPNIASGTGQGRANAWQTYSSRRWKENITPIDNALSKVGKLQGVYYDWLPEQGGAHDIGFVAEDVAKVIPEVVGLDPDGRSASSMDYSRLTALLVEAIKEQQKRIDRLESEIAALKRP